MADNDQLLQQLKGKYQAVLNEAPQLGVQLQNVHIEGGKLLIRGKAPSDQIKNRIWDRIKQVDPNYSDLTADFTVDPSLPQPAAAQPASQAGGGQAQGARTYKVQSGDTLSKIAKEVYGNANQYNKIFEANRDKLDNPDRIYPGQELVIP